MKDMIRIDKFLADMGIGTRTEVKTYIKKGRIQVNGIRILDSSYKVSVSEDKILFDSVPVKYSEFEYYMLNKPQGIVSAVKDNFCTTVVELIKSSERKDLFPVGRLDKDTEGLLLITNDGELAHSLLSPNKHVAKIYYAHVKGIVTEQDIKVFKEGIRISEDFQTLPSTLEIIKSDIVSIVKLTIYEGKFHQVKRMFEAVGKEVIYLKRLSMGSLVLDEKLETGEYRKLTEKELELLKEKKC